MQTFLASDVLYQARVAPLIKHALDDAEIGGQKIATSRFLPGIEWLSEKTVAAELDQQLSRRRQQQDRRARARPARHRARVGRRSATRRCSPTRRTASPASADTAFVVKFTNQGENDEFDVKVTVTVEGGDKPIKVSRTVDTVAQGPDRRGDAHARQGPADRRRGDGQGDGREGARRAEDGQQHRRRTTCSSPRAASRLVSFDGRERPDRSGGHRRPVGGCRGADRAPARPRARRARAAAARRRRRRCSASTAQTDLVAHAAALQQAFAALHDRVEEVAAQRRRAPRRGRGAARRRDRLPLAGPLRRLRRADRQPVDDDRAARRASATASCSPRSCAATPPASTASGRRRPRRARALARGGRGGAARARRRGAATLQG